MLALVLGAIGGDPPRTGSVAGARSKSGPWELDPATPAQRTLEPGEVHNYRLALAANRYVRLELDARSINVEVRLWDPVGEPVLDALTLDDGQAPMPLSLRTVRGGPYRLSLQQPPLMTAAGAYRLRIIEYRPSRPSDDRLVAAHRRLVDASRLYAVRTERALQQSLERYREILDEFHALAAPADEAATLAAIGSIHKQLGQLPKTLDFYAQALRIYERVEDIEAQAYLHTSLCWIHDSLGDPDAALARCRRAIGLFRQAGSAPGEAAAHNALGQVYRHLGELEPAQAAFRRVLKLTAVDAERQTRATALNSLGLIQYAQGEPQAAFDAYARALPLFRAVGDHRGEAALHNNLGLLLARLGQLERSLVHFGLAVGGFRARGDRRSLAQVIANVGRVHQLRGEEGQALEHYHEALELARDAGYRLGEASTLIRMGRLHLDAGQSVAARTHFEAALAIHRQSRQRVGEAEALTELGRARLAQGQPDAALEHFRGALRLRRNSGERWSQATSLGLIARAERDRGRLTHALARSEEALAVVESLRSRVDGRSRRAAYRASVQHEYELYIDLLMQRHREQPAAGWNRRALEAAERGRARVLLETLKAARVDFRKETDPALLARERALQQTLSALERDRVRDAVAVDGELRARLAEMAELQEQIFAEGLRRSDRAQPRSLDAAMLQHLVVDRDSLLLEYALGTERSYLWAVSRQRVDSHELPPRSVIERAAREVYTLLTARAQRIDFEAPFERRRRIAAADQALPRALARLGDILLGPVAGDLDGRRLLVVGDSAIQYVPFGALPLPGALDGENDQPLVVEHEIVRLPSASVLAALRQNTVRRRPTSTLAVLADPVFDLDDERAALMRRAEEAPAAGELELGRVARLPFTRDEAEALAALVPRDRRLVALGFDASRETALSPALAASRMVHFATHAVLDSDNPELSGVVLSLVGPDGGPRNGFLRLHDVYNLDLAAELVVLSACRTALGREIRGEGLIGLTRGFMYAGAPTVVASLWSTEDRATAELMKRFYRGMLRDGQPPSAALRAAQVAMWRQSRWRAPFFWAGFVLHGEWRPSHE